MLMLDQPDTEPTMGDVRLSLRPPPSIDPPSHREAPSETRAYQVRVVVAFVTVTVAFQFVLGQLLSWWLDV